MKLPDFVYDEKVRLWSMRLVWGAWFVAMLIPRKEMFDSPPLLAFTILVPAVFFGSSFYKSWRDKRRGYTITYSKDAADGGLLYMEGTNVFFLYFERGFEGKPFTVHTLTDEAWPQKMPAWSHNRKAELMGRIRKEFPRAHFEEHQNLDEVESLRAKLEVRSWN